VASLTTPIVTCCSSARWLHSERSFHRAGKGKGLPNGRPFSVLGVKRPGRAWARNSPTPRPWSAPRASTCAPCRPILGTVGPNFARPRPANGAATSNRQLSPVPPGAESSAENRARRGLLGPGLAHSFARVLCRPPTVGTQVAGGWSGSTCGGSVTGLMRVQSPASPGIVEPRAGPFRDCK